MKIFPNAEDRKEIGKKARELAFLIVAIEVLAIIAFAAACRYDIIKAEGEKLIIPVSAHEKEIVVVPEQPKEKDRVDEIADIIYKLESSSGLNDQKCERIGKHNGYGYAQGVGRNFCLDSDNEMRALVIDWIKDKQSKGLGEKNLLCLYNTGKATNNCDYIQ